MSTSPAIDEAFKPEDMSIDACLAELEKYGWPRLSKRKSGWYSTIDVFVTGQGVSFEASSEFGFTTPKEAINQCYQRLMDAFENIRKS